MTVAYATTAELAEFTGHPAPAAAGRLLERASEVIDDYVMAGFAVDDDNVPTDTEVAAVLRDATCAQVEFWGEVAEDHDIGSLFSVQASIGHLSLAKLPPELGARARRILSTAGALTVSGGDVTTGGQFFGSRSGT